MGALLGLGTGLGLLLIWSAFALPRQPKTSGPARGRVADLLLRAGLTGVSPTSFLALCGMCAAAAAVVVQIATRTPPIAVVAAVAAG